MPDPTYIQNVNQDTGGYALTTDPNQFNVPVPPAAPTPPVAPTGPGPTPSPGSGIVSSTDAKNSLNSDGSALDRITNTPDPYLEYLQKKANNLIYNESAPSVEEKNAAFQGGKLQQKAEQDYSAYKAGLATLGIQTGLSRYAPELQADRMINAANAETSKLAEIQDKEDLAVAKAKQARLNNDATTLKATLSEIRQIKQDKAQALERVAAKRTQDITVANAASTALYKQLKSTPDDQKEALILQYAKDNDVSPATLINALAREEDTQKKFDLSIALQQKSLNKGGSGGASYTPQELRKLRQAGIDITNTKKADNFLYGENKGILPATFENNDKSITSLGGKSKVWDLALALGIPRDVNLSKQDEIDKLFGDSTLTSYVQEMLDNGYTVDEIIEAQK